MNIKKPEQGENNTLTSKPSQKGEMEEQLTVGNEQVHYTTKAFLLRRVRWQEAQLTWTTWEVSNTGYNWAL